MANQQTYICPNCGANINNTKNCEYCGSLLVRFVATGHEDSIAHYKGEDKSFPWLKQELEQSIKEQRRLSKNKENDSVVATDIYFTKDLLKEGELSWYAKHATTEINILSKNTDVTWQDDSEYSHEKKPGLLVAFTFFTEINSKMTNAVISTDYHKECLSKFKSLDSFPLFDVHYNNNLVLDDEPAKSVQYIIDFGEDYIGAANLLSEVLVDVYNFNEDQKYLIGTNVGDSIETFREYAKDQIENQQISANIKDAISAYKHLGKAGAEKGKKIWKNPKNRKWVIIAVLIIIFLILNNEFYWI